MLSASLQAPSEAPPVFIEGSPGIGKSAVMKQAADEAGVGFLDTRASQHDPTDFRGIPAVINAYDLDAMLGGKDPLKMSENELRSTVKAVLDKISGHQKPQAIWLAPEDIPFIGNDKIPERGLWALDEVTSSPPLVQAVLYQAVLDHKIGEHPLKPGWYIAAAGNKIEDRAVTYRMSTALANRFTHVEYEINLDDWIDWAMKHDINANIIAFLKFKPDHLFNFKPEATEKAFCSPRTWEFSSKHIRLQPAKLLPEVLKGTIGEGAKAEFMGFLKLQNELPDIKTIFNGDNFVPKRPDLTYALVGALATHAKGAKMYERMLNYSKHLDVEFGVLLISMLAQKDESSMNQAPSFEKWAIKHADIIRKVN